MKKRIALLASIAALSIATPAAAVTSQLFIIANSKLTPVGDGTAGSVAMPVSGGSSGVGSFNGRTGTVVLLSTDISGAGGLLAANNLSDLVNPALARANLIAAGSGANSDITSLSGLTTALTGAQGGTGVANTGKTIQVGGNFSTAGALQFNAMTTVGGVLYVSASGQVSNSTTLPSGLTIPSPTISGPSIAGGALSGTFTGGTFSGPTINGATINSPTITGLTLSNVTITNPTFAGTETHPDSSTWTSAGLNGGQGAGIGILFNTNLTIGQFNSLVFQDGTLIGCGQLGTSAGGGVTCHTPSDRRLKVDRGQVDDTRALAALDTIQAHAYSFKRGTYYDGDATHYGFFAQDIEQIFPELVQERSSKDLPGGKELHFDRLELVAILWRQNQAMRTSQLEDEGRIATLEKMNRELVALLPKSVHLVKTAARGH